MMTTQEKSLARYVALSELGRGATGAVYAARDRETGAMVALKTVGGGLAARFLQQARAAQRLSHAHIAAVHDAGEEAGIAYAAMELLEGETLRAILDKGPLPLARAVRIAQDIASALEYAHLEGMVHGSIKPSNIFILPSGVAKLADFGTGEPGACPEQAPDHRCDLFLLGAVLYEMLTRRPPADAEVPMPSVLNQNVPRALDRIVLSLLARNPDERMPGAPVLLRDLEQVAEGLGIEPEAAPSEPAADREPRTDGEAFDAQEALQTMERESRLQRTAGARSRLFPALASVLAVVALAVSGYTYWSASRLPQLAPAPVAEAKKPAPAPILERPLGTERAVAAPNASSAAHSVESPPPAPLAAAPEPVKEPAPARLIVAVAPRGAIYIDGEYQGTTPPVTTFDLEPGMRRIEVRSGSRKPYLTYMTVQPGEVRRVQHDFNAKGRPPR